MPAEVQGRPGAPAAGPPFARKPADLPGVSSASHRPASLALALALALAAGCSEPPTEPYVRALEKMAKIMDRYAHDCESMGRALDKLMRGREGEAIRAYNAHYDRLNARERDALSGSPYGERVAAAMALLAPGHRRCHTHATVRAAFQRL